MAQPPIDVERVVREVLAEMGHTVALPAAPAPAPAAAATIAAEGELRIGARVVSMADLPDRLAGVCRVVVPADAMVTPLVRDELQRKNIALVYERPRSAARPAAGARLVLVTLGGSYDPAGLVRSLRADGLEVDSHCADCLAAASDLVAAEVAGGGALGAVLTRHAAVALCLANRLPGVRAVQAVDAAQAGAAAGSVGANVLVISPREMPPYQLGRVLRDFCRAGVRPCPEELKGRLT